MTGDVFGTPLYISPEQISAVKEVDFRADCYALGIIAYLLSVGYFPFSSESSWEMLHQHLNAAAPIPSNLNPRLPIGLDGMLLRGLAKDPAERYGSAGEFAKAFTMAIRECEVVETIVLAWQPTPQATQPKDYVGLESFLSSPFRTSMIVKAQKAPPRRKSLLRVAAGIETVLAVGLLTLAANGGLLSAFGLGQPAGGSPAATQLIAPSASPIPATATQSAAEVAVLPSEQILADFFPTSTLAPTNTFAPTDTLVPTSTPAPTDTLAPTEPSTPVPTLPPASPTWYASAIPLGTQSSAPQEEALLFSALRRSSFAASNASAATEAPKAATFTMTPAPTRVSPTKVFPTVMIPATSTPIPAARVQPTQVPPTYIPPTQVPPTQIPPTQIPPTQVPPTSAPSGGLLDSLLPPIVPTLLGKIL